MDSCVSHTNFLVRVQHSAQYTVQRTAECNTITACSTEHRVQHSVECSTAQHSVQRSAIQAQCRVRHSLRAQHGAKYVQHITAEDSTAGHKQRQISATNRTTAHYSTALHSYQQYDSTAHHSTAHHSTDTGSHKSQTLGWTQTPHTPQCLPTIFG